MLGRITGLMIGAAVGYWVLERAENHKRGLRRIGRWLGGAIIALALVGIVCRLTWLMRSTDYPMRGRAARQVGPSSTLP